MIKAAQLQLLRETYQVSKQANLVGSGTIAGAAVGAGLSQLRMPGKNKKPLSVKQRLTRGAVGALGGGALGYKGSARALKGLANHMNQAAPYGPRKNFAHM